MGRIDVLKGIEKILVEKAYEIGHISHRRDGDWQKTNSGWVKVKQNSTPKAGGSGGGDESLDDYIDWDSIDNDTMLEHAYDMMPRNIQDKYDINDVLKMWQEKRGLKEGQTDINAKKKNKEKKRLTPTTLKELADESGMGVDELREYLESNGVEIEDDEGSSEDAPDGEDDWDRYDDITDMIQNTDWESIVAEYDNPSVDQIMSDYDFPDDERIRDEISTYIHTDGSDEDYEQDNEDLDNTDSVIDSEKQTPDAIFRNSNNIDKFLESNNIDLSYGGMQKFTGYISELANAYRDGKDTDEILEEFKQRNEVYNNEEAQEGYDTFIKYLSSSPLSSLIQKSAVRDMRSAPIVKNMGF